MLFLRGLTTSITTVPSRLRHPWDFYSKCIFLTLFCFGFFFFQMHFYHCDNRQRCKGRNLAQGMRKERINGWPQPGQMVSSRLVLKAVMMPLGRGARQWPQGPDAHMSIANLRDGCVGYVLKPAPVKYQSVFILIYLFI